MNVNQVYVVLCLTCDTDTKNQIADVSAPRRPARSQDKNMVVGYRGETICPTCVRRAGLYMISPIRPHPNNIKKGRRNAKP